MVLDGPQVFMDPVPAQGVASPDAVGKIMGERDRLAAPDQMGHLFKVLGLRHPDMPPLAGFSALKEPT